MSGITGPQMKKLWALARELNLDSDLLHSVVKQKTGKESLKDLSINEARIVIDHLGTLAAGRGESSRTVVMPVGDGTRGVVTAMASEKQIKYIHDLARALGWDRLPDRLRGFLRKYAKVDDPRWLTRDAAWRVTEGLKRMVREAKSRAAEQA